MVYTIDEFKLRVDFFLKRTQHYFFISSYRIYADSQSDLITEGSPKLIDVIEDPTYLSSNDYALVKTFQEQMLVDSTSRNWTIVRPSITYGGNRFQLGVYESEILLSRVNDELPLLLPREMLNKLSTMTWAGDVAKLMCQLALDSRCFREDFNILTSETRSWDYISNIYSELLGAKFVKVDLNEFYSISDDLWHLTYDRMYNRSCSNEKILKFLNQENYVFKSVKDGLGNTLEQLELVKPNVNANVNRRHGRMDRLLKIWRFPFRAKPTNIVKYYIGRISFLDKIL